MYHVKFEVHGSDARGFNRPRSTKEEHNVIVFLRKTFMDSHARKAVVLCSSTQDVMYQLTVYVFKMTLLF